MAGITPFQFIRDLPLFDCVAVLGFRWRPRDFQREPERQAAEPNLDPIQTRTASPAHTPGPGTVPCRNECGAWLHARKYADEGGSMKCPRIGKQLYRTTASCEVPLAIGTFVPTNAQSCALSLAH